MKHQEVLDLLIEIGEEVCDSAVKLLTEKTDDLTAVHTHSNSDVIYKIDTYAEDIIIKELNKEAERFGGIVLVAEGIGEDEITVYPEQYTRENAALRIIMDPIDGTRGLMYDKRPAFFLAGAAENKGDKTSLQDLEVSVMVEISTSKMFTSDTLFAIKGNGTGARRRNLHNGEITDFTPEPSKSPTIRGGFAQISRFFTPGKQLLAKIEEELLATLFPDAEEGEILSFEDQYISSGGQLYEILTGKDRFIADLRHTLYTAKSDEMRYGHVCHPYDLAAHMIGVEAGLRIMDPHGNDLNAKLETTLATDWVAYANEDIYQEVSPVLNSLLKKYKLIEG
ncbi:MAG: hypothetical protein MK193_04370 [Lentisphaeria bacterium]|nr:hypothetical protein [Lentisphaeria bacterium]